jgi:hypothetical protein
MFARSTASEGAAGTSAQPALDVEVLRMGSGEALAEALAAAEAVAAGGASTIAGAVMPPSGALHAAAVATTSMVA